MAQFVGAESISARENALLRADMESAPTKFATFYTYPSHKLQFVFYSLFHLLYIHYIIKIEVILWD